MAKVGVTDARCLQWPSWRFLLREKGRRVVVEWAGIFPDAPRPILNWRNRYREYVRQIDVVGWPRYDSGGMGVVKRLGIDDRIIPASDTEPIGYGPTSRVEPTYPCYMSSLAGKRVLIVNPMAELMATRARQDVHERCWKGRSTWWSPSAVIPLAIPSGFDANDRARFGSWDSLLTFVVSEIKSKDFDVALIAAGGYGVPIAAEVKAFGKVAICMGGMLQLLFGLSGERWLNRDDFKSLINDAWLRPSANFRPTGRDLNQLEGCEYW